MYYSKVKCNYLKTSFFSRFKMSFFLSYYSPPPLSHVHILLFTNRTSNRVLTTVMGISRAPDMERAVMPKEIACRAVNGSSKSRVCFSQWSDEKYRPTPGITLVIDYELTIIVVIAMRIQYRIDINFSERDLTGVMPFQSPKTFSFWTMFATVPSIPFLGDLYRKSSKD